MSSSVSGRRGAIIKSPGVPSSRVALSPTLHLRSSPEVVLSDQSLPPRIPFANSSTTSTSNDSLSVSSPAGSTSFFEKQWTDDMRRREMEMYIGESILLINSGVYLYQRLDGLQRMEKLLSQLMCDWRSLSEESAKQIQLQRDQLERDVQIFDRIHNAVSREGNTVACVVHSIVGRRNVSRTELRHALVVLEGCCLLSPKCSTTLFQVQGVKQLVRIASDAAVRRDLNRSGNNNANADDDDDDDDDEQSNVGTSYDDDEWEDIRLLAIDILEACLHNSTHNVLMFCENHWVDSIVAMIRDDSLSIVLRSKSVEFVALLLRFVRQTLDKPSQEKIVTAGTMKSLSAKLEEYLGSKLASELKKMELRVNHDQKRGNMIDLHCNIFDSFISLVDQH